MTVTHFGAGTETIGITLSTLLQNIIHVPGLQAKIQEEIDTAWKDGRLEETSCGILKMGEMKRELKFLEACLRESMRLHPVAGVPFPRVVGEEGLLIEEIVIPRGVSAIFSLSSNNILTASLPSIQTVVGVNPWVLGRSKELYGLDANMFNPGRWLSMSREERIRVGSSLCSVLIPFSALPN